MVGLCFIKPHPPGSELAKVRVSSELLPQERNAIHRRPAPDIQRLDYSIHPTHSPFQSFVYFKIRSKFLQKMPLIITKEYQRSADSEIISLT